MIEQKIPVKTKKLLCRLADKYETCCFCDSDPSCILHRYADAADAETAAFIMAVLSFGRRDLFMKKADMIFSCSGAHPSEWIRSGKWKKDFPGGSGKFYRFYSYDDLRAVFAVLQEILHEEKTFGSYMKKRYDEARGTCGNGGSSPELAPLISSAFGTCRAVSHTKQSANKRIHMFLRWMVRTGSPVDLGLWTWFSPSDLLIPLDTHVLQESVKLGLIPEGSTGTAGTARRLTDVLRQVWPDDPARGDFALFGLGMDQ
jgi:uncharacterized protein (TIGR02757 family)